MDKIAQSAVENMSDDLAAIRGVDVGDLTWSARTSKTKWLLCDGSAVSRTTYAALFAAIGTAFGAGNGSSTFNLPDGRGRTLLGVGTGSGLTARTMGASGGAETHQLAATEMPSHRHKLWGSGAYSGTAATGLGDSGSKSVAGNTNTSSLGYVDANNGKALVESTGGGGAHNNMMPFVAANLFIYAGA